MADRWPRYVPVTFATGVNVSPEHLNTLNRAGLPKRLLDGDMILEEPVGFDVPNYGYLIRFAQGGRGGFYFDPLSGKVLDVIDRPGPPPRVVNSTLDQFTSTVKAIIEAFPFYLRLRDDWDDAELDAVFHERASVAARLRQRLVAIDPAAGIRNGFWDGFLVDLMDGEYATEDILGDDYLPPDPAASE